MAVRAALLLTLTVAAVPAAADGTVLFLSAGERSRLDEGALLDAVAIYTRDLGLVVRVELGAPAALTPAAVALVLARARAAGARLVFWCTAHRGPGGGTIVLYTVAGDGGRAPEVHEAPVPGPAPDVDRALALKLRAILTGAVALDPMVARRAIPLPAPASAAAPATGAGGAAPPPRAGPRRRAQVAAGYWLTAPRHAELIRQGLSVEAATTLGAHLEAHVGLEVTTRPSISEATGIATLLDLPIRLGARGLLRRGRWGVGGGPVVTVHVLAASGLAPDGARGDSTQVSIGLGAAALARRRISSHLSVDLRLLIERTVPRTRFLLGGLPAIDEGALLLGAGLALGFAAP
ncbi:MAG TPA: hypothetical protein VGQ83_31425 [Polyangia bacterium]